MNRYDFECELCGEKSSTVCIGALRLCCKCAARKIADYKPRNLTLPRTYRDLDDCAIDCGNYYNLVSMLYCIGELTSIDVNEIVECLDDIFDGRL